MQILDGRVVAQKWRDDIRQQLSVCQARGVTPGLAVVLVGDDPASVLYTSMKEKVSRELGFVSLKIVLSAQTTTDELCRRITELNLDPAIHGILVQLPLPAQIDTNRVLEVIDPHKDVDGLHPTSLGNLLIGNEQVVPATPRGILYLLDAYDVRTSGQHVVIIGRSNILGKPLAAMFLNRDATVTICHRKTRNLAALTRQGDIVVMDTGVPGLLRADMVKPGAVVVDAGISKDATGQVVGDVVFAEVAERAGAITPVPGGVGPMTIAALLQNTVDLATAATILPGQSQLHHEQ